MGAAEGPPHRVQEGDVEMNWLDQIKYIRVQIRGVAGHTIAEFRNGSSACSCGNVRGNPPVLR